MVIYIDILLITNFLISYFLLLGSAVLSGYTFNRKNIVFSAIIGAFSCLYILCNQQAWFLNLIYKIFTLFICSVAAFGFANKRRLFIQMAVYIFLNMLLTGITAAVGLKSNIVYGNNMFYYISINPVTLVLSSAVIYILITVFEIVKDKISPQKLYMLDVIFKDFTVVGIPAFYDSGFKIKDIVSNNDVIIVSSEKIQEKIPQKLYGQIKGFIREEFSEVEHNFTPVFFSTLSGGGMLPAVKAEYINVNGKKINNILVAFTDNSLSENVTAIFGTDIRKQL